MALPVRRRNMNQATQEPVRWLPTEPFAHFDDLYRRMNDLFRMYAVNTGIDVDGGQAGWSMPFDLEETDDAYVVEIDLPGAKAKDVTLDWNGRQLTVHGEVKERERVGLVRRRTRRTGRFDYTITLPGEVDDDRIDANLADGVLTIHVPKAERAKSRRIQIGTATKQTQPNQ